jgi:hypothetical protein
MPTLHEQLEAMRSLRENWDGYDAAAPKLDAIDLAKEFVALIQQLQRHSPAGLHVSPTRVGGVLIDWENAQFEHEIDIGPDGSIGFLHRQSATGHITVKRFTPAAVVVQAGLLDELRQLLAA